MVDLEVTLRVEEPTGEDRGGPVGCLWSLNGLERRETGGPRTGRVVCVTVGGLASRVWNLGTTGCVK